MMKNLGKFTNLFPLVQLKNCMNWVESLLKYFYDFLWLNVKKMTKDFKYQQKSKWKYNYLNLYRFFFRIFDILKMFEIAFFR